MMGAKCPHTPRMISAAAPKGACAAGFNEKIIADIAFSQTRYYVVIAMGGLP
jgi:hypothetical protein